MYVSIYREVKKFFHSTYFYVILCVLPDLDPYPQTAETAYCSERGKRKTSPEAVVLALFLYLLHIWFRRGWKRVMISWRTLAWWSSTLSSWRFITGSIRCTLQLHGWRWTVTYWQYSRLLPPSLSFLRSFVASKFSCPKLNSYLSTLKYIRRRLKLEISRQNGTNLDRVFWYLWLHNLNWFLNLNWRRVGY